MATILAADVKRSDGATGVSIKIEKYITNSSILASSSIKKAKNVTDRQEKTPFSEYTEV